jgi:hypothetical protein
MKRQTDMTVSSHPEFGVLDLLCQILEARNRYPPSASKNVVPRHCSDVAAYFHVRV